MKRFLLAIVLCLAMLTVLFSCNENPAVVQIVEYSTPTIKGTISITSGSSVSPDGVYVKVIDSSNKTVTIQKVSTDGTFVIQNLTADAKYKLLFTSKEPDTFNRDVADEKGTDGVGCWMQDVVPAVKEGKDVGSVKMKPLGTIKGKVVVDGATEHYDTTVYIPGTSYVAMTDKDGNYAIYNVPEGTYTLRYTHEDCVAVMTEDVMVICTDDTTHPEKTLGEVKLLSNKGTVQGKAVLGDASDSTGITIKLESEDKSRSYTASTSADGTYTLTDVEPGRYRVIASYSTYLSQSTEYFDVAVGTVTSVSEKLELLENYGILKGYASLSDSEKKEGIQILIKDTSSTNSYALITDAEGAFTKKLKPGEYSVTASLSDYSSQTKTVTVVEDETVEMVFSPLTSAYGTISGKSASTEETVFLVNSEGAAVDTTVTSDDCAYKFTKVTPGTYSVRFSKTNYASYVATNVLVTTAGTTTVNGETLVSSFGKISGTSNSIGETVSLFNGLSSVVNSVITRTDRKYEFNNLSVGNYTLSFSKEGYSTYETSSYTVSNGSNLTVNGIALSSKYGAISGKSESVGETVYLIRGTQPVQSAITLESKEYSFMNVDPGEYIVCFVKTDYTSYDSSSITVEAGQSYVIDGERLSAIYGSISGKTATSGEFVSLLSSTRTILKTVQTSSDCTFNFSRLEPGTYSLSISKDGYFSTTVSDVIVVAGEDNSITTPELISTNGTVSGFVTLEGSSDNSGVIITLTDSSDSENVYSEVSAADGSFRIMGIKKTSNYLLTYSKDGYVSNLSNSVDVTVGKVITADSVTLKSVMSTVSGKIQLEGTSSYENITILLKSGDNDYTATTDQKGEYRINGVLPGTYTLLASKNGYVRASTKEFVVESSSEKEVELLSLSVAVRSVIGKVTLELGTDHAGTLVTATNLSDSKIVYSAITNSDGDYTLAGMVPGEYQIVISKSGYMTATLTTTNIVANTLTDAGSTELAIAKGEITGIARLEGCSDYSGIKVSIVGTSFETLTAKDGTYSFTVPTGNYSGGIRYEYEDFETTSYVANIAVLQTTSYSDAYAVPDQELKCINVPKVSGKVSVAGSTKVQYEDITISIVELPEFTFTTEADGKYTFEHVPVGTYTFEFTRENARKVTKMVAIEPSLEITIEDIELIPDAVTLYGNISLSGLSDYSGVTVRVTTSDSVELKTVTNAAGYWYIGNIIASKEHTIYFEKSGWATKSYAIAANTYEPMSLNDCTSTYPVVLEDKVSPVITSLTATVGKSTEDGRGVYLYLYTQEEGSGIKYIQGNTSDSFDSITEQSYYNPFKLIIPDEVGDTTIYVRVKDAAGNISNTVSTNVTLKNDKTELYQTLSGDKLHLTYENSPYVMTDNILVPEGEILVIDPGVEIQVKGEYYIQVEGTLSAVGTEDKHIKIYGVEEGQDKWKGIKIINGNDTKIVYAEITGITEGVQGYAIIENSIITASDDGFALGYFVGTNLSSNRYYQGCIVNSNIKGKICAHVIDVLNNSISSESIDELTASGSIFNNKFTGTLKGSITDSSLIQNTFSGIGTLSFSSVYLMNNEINVSKVQCGGSIVKYTTFNNSVLSIRGGTWSYDVLNNCTFSAYSVCRFTNSNLNGCGNITIKASRSSGQTFNMTNNYWGDDKTVELEQKEIAEKISFIYHYPDDFNLAPVDWSNYRKTALSDCGYQGKGFRTTGNYSGYKVGDIGPAGGIVFYDKGFYSDGWRYLECSNEDLGSYIFGYYRPNLNIGCEVGTSTALGSGKDNTDYLVEAMDINGEAYSSNKTSDTTTSEYAARKCYDYQYGGYSDWFLPCKDELELIYENIKIKGINSLCYTYYWSSSEHYNDSAWYRNINNGYPNANIRSMSKQVCAIRRF